MRKPQALQSTKATIKSLSLSTSAARRRLTLPHLHEDPRETALQQPIATAADQYLPPCASQAGLSQGHSQRLRSSMDSYSTNPQQRLGGITANADSSITGGHTHAQLHAFAARGCACRRQTTAQTASFMPNPLSRVPARDVLFNRYRCRWYGSQRIATCTVTLRKFISAGLYLAPAGDNITCNSWLRVTPQVLEREMLRIDGDKKLCLAVQTHESK